MMDREEAKDLFIMGRDAYGRVKSPIAKVNKIYDDFESRVCKNCKYLMRSK